MMHGAYNVKFHSLMSFSSFKLPQSTGAEIYIHNRLWRKLLPCADAFTNCSESLPELIAGLHVIYLCYYDLRKQK